MVSGTSWGQDYFVHQERLILDGRMSQCLSQDYWIQTEDLSFSHLTWVGGQEKAS